MIRVLSLVLTVASTIFVFGATSTATPAPDISGVWRVDLDLSHGADKWDKTYRVVITQSDDEIVFHYFDRKGNDLGTDEFIADGVERPRWKTHIERAYATVRWRGKKLLIDTCSVQNSYFNQMYYTYDAWQLTDDHMLGHKLTDGKLMLFRREADSPHHASALPDEKEEW